MKYSITKTLVLTAISGIALAQDLPMTRRLSILTQKFLDSADVKIEPTPVSGEKTPVLLLFRLSESGAILDCRASGGSERARDAALNALRAWRFKPSLLAGRPAQMHSGIVFDFSASPVRMDAPSPMSAEQISPVLSARCPLAMLKKDSEAVNICRKESVSVDKNRAHTAMESLSAHDELGLAFLQLVNDPGQALGEFDRAIELAPQGLKAVDGEWAEIHWHRAAAEQLLGQFDKAFQDFSIAEEGFEAAAGATKVPAYRDLLTQVAKVHSALLDKNEKHDEAAALLKKLGIPNPEREHDIQR